MNVLKKLVDKAASTPALDKPAERVADTVEAVMAGQPNREVVENTLHGTWLGHPLHPVLTDLPIGAWTLAGVMDAADMLAGNGRSSATPAIAFGLVASLPTASAGVMDWRHGGTERKRVGVAHAALNGGALALYTASLLLRPTHVGLARLLGFGGLGLVSASAYLGGHLISNMGMGVKHESPATPPAGPAAASLDGELAENTPRRVELQGYPVTLVRHNGRLFALADVCPHMGCSLSNGSVSGDALMCACHGSTFALEDGRVLKGPSAFPVRAFRASGEGAAVTISPPDAPGQPAIGGPDTSDGAAQRE